MATSKQFFRYLSFLVAAALAWYVFTVLPMLSTSFWGGVVLLVLAIVAYLYLELSGVNWMNPGSEGLPARKPKKR